MTRIRIARAWCDEHLQECFFAYNENTGSHQHVGPETQDLAAESQQLKAQGYQSSHRSGVYTFTLYKAAPLTLPLDWQMVLDAHEAEAAMIDDVQDW